MIVRFWNTKTHYRSDAQEIPCGDAYFSKDNGMLVICYQNGNQTYIFTSGMTRVDIMASTDKSCPTCFRLIEEKK